MAQMWVDPPQGWRYGFPKPIPDDVKDHRHWLIEHGYPKEIMDKLGEHFYCRYWYEVVDAKAFEGTKDDF